MVGSDKERRWLVVRWLSGLSALDYHFLWEGVGFEIIASSEVAPVAFDMTETAVPIGFCGRLTKTKESGLSKTTSSRRTSPCVRSGHMGEGSGFLWASEGVPKVSCGRWGFPCFWLVAVALIPFAFPVVF